MAVSSRYASLHHTARLIGTLLVMLLGAWSIQAQGSSGNVQAELVAISDVQDELIVHVRVPRGLTISDAQATQGEQTLTLVPEVLPLPVTQYILIDASGAMVNLQSVIQTSVGRLWRNEQNTSLIYYNRDVQTLNTTEDSAQLDAFLSDYAPIPGEPACIGDAFTELTETVRDYDRSWRILLITTGDLSDLSGCAYPTLPDQLPAPIEIIAITQDVDEAWQTLISANGGQITSANLRSLETSINDVLTRWGQSSYALRGALPTDWDRTAPFDLTLTLDDDSTHTLALLVGAYTRPIPPTPSPTEALATPLLIEDTPTTTDGAVLTSATDAPSMSDTGTDTPPSPDSNVALLLIIGALLFIVGAIVLAIALSRIRRVPTPPTAPEQPHNFYETLGQTRSETGNKTPTRIRERGLLGATDAENPTRIADMADNDPTQPDANDELLVTQMLSDEQFRAMMAQSTRDDNVIGWMRLSIANDDSTYQDYQLTMRGAVIGRSQECDIQITGDRAISRKHARIDVRESGQVTVSRLSAVNPVMVGGVQISNRHPLRANDVIHLSDETRLVFIANDEAQTDAPES
ncbi:MAG: FHA domain-containing protein [Anaerolineae bacterium]